MSIAHSQAMTLTGDTIVDRGRPTQISTTAAQAVTALSDNTDVPASAQKATASSSPSSLRETPVTIPPDHLGDYRTLVLCFDGTGDQFDADNSNIVQLVALLKKSDRSKQLVYYQVGCFSDRVFKETKLMILCAVRRGLGRTLLQRLLRPLCRPFGR